MLRLKIGLGVAVAVLLVLSCVTLPPIDKAEAPPAMTEFHQSYALVYTEVRNTKFDDLPYSYRMSGTEKSRIVLPMETSFTEIDSLREGTLLTYKIEIIDKKTSEGVGEIEDFEVFTVEERSVSILPKKAVVTLRELSNGKMSQKIEFRDLKDDEIEKCIEYVKNQEKYNGLRIRTTE